MDVIVEFKNRAYTLSEFFPLLGKTNYRVQINKQNFFLSFDKKNLCFFLSMENNKSFSRVISLRNIIRNTPKELLYQEISFNTHRTQEQIEMTCGLDYPHRKKRQKNLEAQDLKVVSPLSGTLVKNLRLEGFVKKNDVILIIDAMKLENKIIAPKDGYLKLNPFEEGSQIKSGDLLFSLENKAPVQKT